MTLPHKKGVRKVIKAWAVVSKELGLNAWPPYGWNKDDQYHIFPLKKAAVLKAQEWTGNNVDSQAVPCTITYTLPKKKKAIT